MNQTIKLGIYTAATVLFLSSNLSFGQFQQILFSGNSSWRTQTNPAVGAIGIGQFPNGTNLPSVLTINGTLIPTPTGEVFRTIGPSISDNAWRMFTGAGNGTEKFSITTPAGSNNAIIKVTNIGLMNFFTNNNQRMRITSTDQLILNPPYLGITTANTTRVAINHLGNDPIVRPMSLLHLGNDIGINPDGWRDWMDIGTFTHKDQDHTYVGLKFEQGNGYDAVIGWGSNPILFDGADDLRFIFTSDAQVGPSPGNTNKGLEIARLVPNLASSILLPTQNYGMMGIGDFSPGSPNAVAGDIVDAKLDIDGDLRIRQVNENLAGNMDRVLVIDHNDLNRVYWRDANSFISGGASADNGVSIFPAASSNVQLGQNNTNGASLLGGELLNAREIPLNGQNLLFSRDGMLSIGVQGGSKFRVRNVGALPNVVLFETDNGDDIFTFTEDKHLRINAEHNTATVGQEAVRITNTLSKPTAQTFFGLNVRTTATVTTGNYYGTVNIMIGKSADSKQIIGLFSAARAPSNDGVGNYIGVLGTADRACLSCEKVGVLGNAGAGAATNIGIKGIGLSGAPVGNNYAGWFQGDVNVTGILFTANGGVSQSDNMFKTNQQPIVNAINIISQLTPKTYNLDSANFTQFGFDTKQHMGFVAQEVEQILPELITNTQMIAQRDTSGNLISSRLEYKALNYQEFIPLLIAGMQEQQSLIDSLKGEVTTLSDCLQQANLCNNGARINNSGEEGTVVELENLNAIILDVNHPNPFKDKTTITYTIPDEVVNAQLLFYDMNGRIIKDVTIAERGEGKITVYGENLKNGIYTYSLIADGELIATKRMVKSK